MLEVTGLEVRYGNVTAVKGISLEVAEGEVVAIIGPNGAGKTSTLRAITGLVPSAGGRVVFRGTDVSRWKAHRIVTLGLGHAPEGRRLFPQMTVMENLRMGAYRRRGPAEIGRTLAQVEELFPRLAERRAQLAGTLSGGEQQMLAIGRALMTRPRLLMLDEPSQGIMPKLVDEIFAAVKRIRDAGMTVLIVEQRMAECLEIADRAYILQTGRVLMQGAAAEIMGNPDVRKAYLGL